MTNRANVAATLMEHFCTHDWHGYTQGSGRWGDGEGYCQVEAEGQTWSVAQGDRDCSSAVIDCWKTALEGTGYTVGGATYTGNMRAAFVASGCFEWKPMSFIAQRGDIYLNEASHTAMCTCASPDTLAEFSINETGGITGGTVGDQTGNESHVRSYYDFPWDGILHYTGAADDAGGNTSETSSGTSSKGVNMLPRYRVYIRERGWLPWLSGLYDEGGSSDDFAGIEGCWIYGIQIEDLGPNGWYKVERADGSSTLNDTREDTGSAVTGIVVYYDTQDASNGYLKAKYRVHWQGDNPGWGKWEYDDEDGGAGKNAASPLDMVQIELNDND